MKLAEHELVALVARLAADEVPQAVSTLRRVNRIQRLLSQQLDLIDTMSPRAYMRVREGLGRGSGQESPGFKAMLRLPGELVWPAFAGFLAGRGVTLRAIYDDPDAHHALYQLAEGLVDYDQQLQLWRQRHLMMVYRIIGAGTPSLKGKPTELLAHGLKTRFFPALWEVRDEVFGEWTRAQQAKGADTGYHG
jgi:tryptophan 2,3-dioxygenase